MADNPIVENKEIIVHELVPVGQPPSLVSVIWNNYDSNAPIWIHYYKQPKKIRLPRYDGILKDIESLLLSLGYTVQWTGTCMMHYER